MKYFSRVALSAAILVSYFPSSEWFIYNSTAITIYKHKRYLLKSSILFLLCYWYFKIFDSFVVFPILSLFHVLFSGLFFFFPFTLLGREPRTSHTHWEQSSSPAPPLPQLLYVFFTAIGSNSSYFSAPVSFAGCVNLDWRWFQHLKKVMTLVSCTHMF